MLVFSLPWTDPRRNLAVEEYLLRQDAGEYLLFWRNDSTIVVGRNQNADEEINRDLVEARGINVVRRMSGGGAVYHDLNNLNFSFITALRGGGSMREFSQRMADALNDMGIAVELSGRNDLEVEGRKVSGNAQALYKDRILHHGTLLFDVDLTVLSACLKVKPEKFRSRATRSVRSRVANLKDFWTPGASVTDFMAALQEKLAPQSGCRSLTLDAAAESAVRELQESKYATREWTYGQSPACSLRRMRAYDGGILEIHCELRKGLIADLAFYGDFLSLRDVTVIAQALRGTPCRAQDVARVLALFALDEYFGGITCEEILDCFFHDGEDPAAAAAPQAAFSLTSDAQPPAEPGKVEP